MSAADSLGVDQANDALRPGQRFKLMRPPLQSSRFPRPQREVMPRWRALAELGLLVPAISRPCRRRTARCAPRSLFQRRSLYSDHAALRDVEKSLKQTTCVRTADLVLLTAWACRQCVAESRLAANDLACMLELARCKRAGWMRDALVDTVALQAHHVIACGWSMGGSWRCAGRCSTCPCRPIG